MPKIEKTEEEWKKELDPDTYRIIRQKGTERAFTGRYWNNKEQGVYLCAGCGAKLFSSETKYDSGSGWPSFWAPVDPQNVEAEQDASYGMVRTEIHCSQCGAHLGHIFPDGPRPTGQRYCINSGSLRFEKKPVSQSAPSLPSPTGPTGRGPG